MISDKNLKILPLPANKGFDITIGKIINKDDNCFKIILVLYTVLYTHI